MTMSSIDIRVLTARLIRVSIAALVLICANTVVAQTSTNETCELDFRVEVHYESSPRMFDVNLTFPSEGRTESYLRLQPKWAGVDDFASYLTDWRAIGDETSIAPTDEPFRFRVTHASSGAVQVAFKARGGLPDPDNGKPQTDHDQYRTQIGADWFQFFGYGVFPSVESYGDARKAEMCVTIVQPGGSETPLFGSHLSGHGNATTAHVSGSHFLVRHAFYAGGPGWRITERGILGGPIGVAVRGKFSVGDVAFVDKAATIIDAQRRFWKNEAVAKQWVVIAPNNTQYNHGGTLVQQTAVLYGNQSFTSDSPEFESLIAHENEHRWIPNRLGRSSDDPSQYWFSEGFTDYYTHRLLLSSGAWSPGQYADALTRKLQTYWRSPARNATAQSIGPRFFTDRDAGLQMYSRGEVLAAMWDLALRRSSKGGLDDVLRSLELSDEDHQQSAETANARVLEALTKLLGKGPEGDVDAYLKQGNDLPLPADLLGPCFTVQRVDALRWVLGFDMSSIRTRKAVGVALDGPAYKAGLRDGMDVLGWSIFSGNLERDVSITAMVDGQRKTMTYAPTDGTYEQLPIVQPAPRENGACERWMHRER